MRFPKFDSIFGMPNLLLKTPMFIFGELGIQFWGGFWEAGGTTLQGGFQMRKKNFKGRCEKRILGKCREVCRTYDAIQSAFADVLQESEDIKEIRCNVPLEGLPMGEYTTDFVCVKSDNDLMVRECVNRRLVGKPLTVRLLDASRSYWMGHGVTDWGLVIDAEQ